MDRESPPRDGFVDDLMKFAGPSFCRWWDALPRGLWLWRSRTARRAYLAGMETGIRAVLLISDEVHKPSPAQPQKDK